MELQEIEVTTGDLSERELRVVRRALLSRLVDSRFLELYSDGMIAGTIHTCIGQEFSGAVISEFLAPQDAVFSNHRCHGHFLSCVGDVPGLVAELMGRESGVCGGLGGSQHLHAANFFSNGILGGSAPISAGVACAQKLNRSGQIAVCFLGDGALGEGTIYETLNWAASWSLPLLFVVEDNGIAQSTRVSETFAGSIRLRAESFGWSVVETDTWDWRHLLVEAEQVIGSVRAGGPPHLLIVKTFRLKPHSKGDDTRTRAELQPFEERDPLTLWLANDRRAPEWTAELAAAIEEAVTLGRHSPIATALPQIAPATRPPVWSAVELAPTRVVSALNQALANALERDEKVILLGEDIESPYGGAFKVSQELSERFPGRVRNTPISEASLVGTGIGLALGGYRPVVEIMFGDFITLAFDQLVNHAAKFTQMYAGRVGLNLVVRTPMGGYRGYGPTHSQSLEKHFLGVPGLQVLALNTMVDPKSVLGRLLESDCGPTLLVENKTMYAQYLRHSVPEGFALVHSDEEYPSAWLRADGESCDFTLLGYGGMGEMMLAALERLFDEHDLIGQVLLPTRIFPFSLEPYVEVLQRSASLVVVEEGQSFAGFASEVLAQLCTMGNVGCPRVSRVGPKAACIPACPQLERNSLPGVDDIIDAVLRSLQ